MPFVNIRLVKGLLRDDAAAKKTEMTRRITDAISENTGLPKDQIWVVYEEITNTEWYVGERTVERIWKEDGRP